MRPGLAPILLVVLAPLACTAPPTSHSPDTPGASRPSPTATPTPDSLALILSASPTYAALEASLARDLADERAAPPEPRNILPRLLEALRSTPRVSTTDHHVWNRTVTRVLDENTVAPTLSPALRSLREACAPTVAAVRSTIRTGPAARPFDLEADWPRLARTPYASPPEDARQDEEDLQIAFSLEALAALGAGDAREAARILVDFWRTEDALARDERLPPARDGRRSRTWITAFLLARTIQELDQDAIPELTAALEALETSPLPLATFVRAQRLAHGCRYRDVARQPLYVPCFLPATDLSEAARRLPVEERRAVAWFDEIGRKWAPVDAALRRAETFVALPAARAWSHFASRSARAALSLQEPGERDLDVVDLVHEELAQRLLRTTYTRELRVLAAARSFDLAHGAWPTSVAEALGRAPGPGETDAFDELPLGVEVAREFLVVHSRGDTPSGVMDIRLEIVRSRPTGGPK